MEEEITLYLVRKNANTKSDDGGSLITDTTTPTTSSASSDGASTSTSNYIPPHLKQGLKRGEQLPPPIVLSDYESDPSSPPPKAARIPPHHPLPLCCLTSWQVLLSLQAPLVPMTSVLCALTKLSTMSPCPARTYSATSVPRGSPGRQAPWPPAPSAGRTSL